MRHLLAILALCSLSFGQTTIFPKTTVFPKTTIFGAAAAAGGFSTPLDHCVAVGTGTCTINSTGANLIVVMDVAIAAAVVTPPTENKSNTFQAPASTACALAGGNGSTQIYYIFSPTVGTSHIFTGGLAANYYFVSAWSGALTGSGVFDAGNCHAQFGGSGTNLTTGSVTPSATNELLLTISINDDNATSWTVPTSFTLIDTNTASASGKSTGYFVDITSSPINPTWTNSVQPNSVAAIAAFKHQ